jgi:transposase
MAYIYGNRYQTDLFPQSIEEYIGQDDPVRVYDAFVESLDLKELGIEYIEVQVGNPEYNPKAMLKLLAYGYSYGVRSSRKLERACYHNVSFIWLMEGLKPDHKTISNFRKNNKKSLKNMFKQCAGLCIKLELIEGNTLFVDGSKIRGNASINSTWTKEKCDKYLANIDERIESILNECDAIDDKEQKCESLVKLKKELKGKEAIKSKVENILKELKKEKVTSINGTDPECVKIKGRQGVHAGYNGQIVVDEKHGLIVHNDVVNESNDKQQFAVQIEQANENLAEACENACADCGYANTSELKKIDEQGITVIVPSQKQALHKKDKKPDAFAKERFNYDAQKDCYVCPMGQEIPYSHFSTKKQHILYRFKNPSVCLSCKSYGVCTNSKRGRAIIRLADEEIKLKLERQYMTDKCQEIYKLRKQKAELPFGHIKRNLAVNAFLLRGLAGAKAEMSIFSTCFNIARMITILGVTGLIGKLTSA